MNTHTDKTPQNADLATTDSQSEPVNDGTTPKYPSENISYRFGGSPKPSPSVAQRKSADASATNPSQPPQSLHGQNRTGLPQNIKSGIEGLSGYSMDDVKVHYNSSKPEQLGALAYTQGTDIHVASGQERHLPHEAWHVVQQKQGRVQPTRQLKSRVDINDDQGLENEADRMGEKALQLKSESPAQTAGQQPSPAGNAAGTVVQRQRKIGFELEDANWKSWQKSWFRAPYWTSPTDNLNCRPMTKRELIHQGEGFRLEADEFVSGENLLSDIEFVTEPFPLNNDGLVSLTTAMNGMRDIYDTIIPLRGRDHSDGEFIKNDESGFSNANAMLSEGANRANLNVQATQGFSLSDIPKAYDALSKPSDTSETPELYITLQHAVVGENDATADATLNPLRDASERATVAVTYINAHIANIDELELTEDDQAGLHGFLTAVIAFVNMMRNPLMIQGGAKTYAPMMHRNDFATTFGMLRENLKEIFRNNRQHFIDGIIASIVNNPGDNLDAYDPAPRRTENIFDRFILETADRRRFLGTDDNPLELPNFVGIRNLSYYILPPSFSIQRWVTAWMDGDNPRDILTKAHFEWAASNDIEDDPDISETLQEIRDGMDVDVAALIDWGRSQYAGGIASLAFNYDALSDRQQGMLKDYTRGLGGLGAETDADDPNLVLYENRVIAPHLTGENDVPINPQGGAKLNVASARTTVLAYFTAMQGLFGEE